MKPCAPVNGYPGEFSQVLLSVFENARKTMQVNRTAFPVITVSMVCEYEFNVLTIRDNGAGLPDQDIDRIFDPYFSSPENTGGVGLYLARYIIEERMKGTIGISNVPTASGSGAEVRIKIPLAKPGEASR